MNKDKFVAKRKILSKSIIILMYLSFISYILGDVQSIADWNFSFHEMLYLPINITYFILPILIIVWLYYAIKSFKYNKASSKMEMTKLYFKNFIIFISLVCIVVYFVIDFHEVSTGGIFTIEDKIYDGNYYYVLIDNKKVRCTWNEYNLIEEGKRYEIDFDWNTYWPDKGKLEYINPQK